MTKIITILGTRPEIIKLSPLIPLLIQQFDHVLVHTGQHYSFEMDAIFFEELRLPKPDYVLDVGSGAHGWQTGQMLTRTEQVLLHEIPDAVIVLGDTNTTLAGALAARKLHIPVVHIEAGCRSFNRAMPEELNRIVADHVSDWLLAPGARERDNLLREGIESEHIHVVGSTAIDACLRNQEYARGQMLVHDLGLKPGEYVLLTIHRAENTSPDVLPGIVAAINQLAERWPFVFPIHPRTRAALGDENSFSPNVRVIEPIGYLDMLHVMSNARAVMTDSGGLQEESVVLGIPLLIARQETEWMYLVDTGAGVLVGNTLASITSHAVPLLAAGQSAFQRMDMAMQKGAAWRTAELMSNWFL